MMIVENKTVVKTDFNREKFYNFDNDDFEKVGCMKSETFISKGDEKNIDSKKIKQQ